MATSTSWAAAAVLASLFPVSATAAQTIRVPADQPSIQQAIAAAAPGDTVLVAPGTYRENLDLLGKAIAVVSSDGADVTVVDGGGQGSVATILNAAAVLRGFTLRNGRAEFDGGGVLVSGGAPVIEGNVIAGNAGCSGLGIALSFTSAVVRGNVIRDNVQPTCSGGIGGGGVEIRGAGAAQVLGNLISGNAGVSDGGGLSLFAAGAPVIRGNVVSGNSAAGSGGGIAMVNGSDADISDNLIVSNSAFQGGGISWLVPSGARGPWVVNNTIADNHAPTGSGIHADGFDVSAQIVNNVIVAAPGETALHCGDFNDLNAPVLASNDVTSPSGSAYGGSCADPTGQAGNVSADPLFADPATGDYRLGAGSPAIDAGTDAAPLHPVLDLAGNARVLDGDADGTARVDMGAYEATVSPALTLSVRALTFAAQLVGTSSASQDVTLSNAGAAAVPVYLVSAGDEFSQTNDCGASLAAGATCTVTVRFVPQGLGSRGGALAIAAAEGVLLATLAGEGFEPPIVVAPSSPSTPPRGAVLLTATGGSGTGFTWSLVTAPSGGSIDAATGAYRAGRLGDVVDVVRVVDSLGGAAEVSVSVGAGVSIAPTGPAVQPRATVTFAASGGSGADYRWSLPDARSGGTIDAVSGAYAAGPLGGVFDLVEVVDGLGNTAQVSVLVTAALAVTPGSASVPPLGSRVFGASGGSGFGLVWSLRSAPSGGSIDPVTGAYRAGARGSVTDVVQVVDSLGAVATANVTVTAALAVSPASVLLPRGRSQAFVATGGSGVGLVWSLATNASGATLDAAGRYTAGPRGGVTDVVQVVDWLGAIATAEVTVTAPLIASPGSITVAPGATVTFTASGGSGAGLVWSLVAAPSGGAIDAVTGEYAAGGTAGVTDVVQVADSLGSTAVATVTVAARRSSGCGQAGASGGWLAALLAALAVRRARRPRPGSARASP